MVNCQLIEHDGSKICIVENNLSIDDFLAELTNPQQYEADLDKLRTTRRKTEFLAIRVALKKALGNVEKEIIYTSDGKPVLKDGSYKISFSHSKGCVAVIVHPCLEVGIDIEAPSKKLLNVHTRFLGSEEQAAYRKNESMEYLRIAWSVKEALFKIIGDSAYNFAEQLQIQPFLLENKGSLQVIHTDTGKYYTAYYLLEENFTLAYCIDNAEHRSYAK